MSLLDKIYINLKIISKIQENGKITTTNPGQITLEEQTLLNALWRTLSGDSRKNTVAFLQQLLNNVDVTTNNLIRSPYFHSFEPSDMYQINEHNTIMEQLKKLSQELRNSKNGVANLHITYNDDASIAAKLEEIMGRIDSLVTKIEKAVNFAETFKKTEEKEKDKDKDVSGKRYYN